METKITLDRTLRDLPVGGSEPHVDPISVGHRLFAPLGPHAHSLHGP